MRQLLLTLPLLVTVACQSTGGLETSPYAPEGAEAVHPCEAGPGAVEAIENQEGIEIDCSRFETE